MLCASPQAPGMLLTHYAPDLPAFLLATTAPAAAPANATPADAALASAVVVDFGARAAHLAPRALAYRDLSAAADGTEAARAARWNATRRHAIVPVPPRSCLWVALGA
eukprot:scaffold49414_cov35-Phaeocystis_antarctica.AAC.1